MQVVVDRGVRVVMAVLVLAGSGMAPVETAVARAAGRSPSLLTPAQHTVESVTTADSVRPICFRPGGIADQVRAKLLSAHPRGEGTTWGASCDNELSVG